MPKQYSDNYFAVYCRNVRQKIKEKDPVAFCKTVWVVTLPNGKQIAFKNKRDIIAKRIQKSELRNDFLKGY